MNHMHCHKCHMTYSMIEHVERQIQYKAKPSAIFLLTHAVYYNIKGENDFKGGRMSPSPP